jgi:hypothetical protein
MLAYFKKILEFIKGLFSSKNENGENNLITNEDITIAECDIADANVFFELRYGFRLPQSTSDADVDMLYTATSTNPRLRKKGKLTPGSRGKYNSVLFFGKYDGEGLPTIDVEVTVNGITTNITSTFGKNKINPRNKYFDVIDFCCGEVKYCECK